MPSEKRSTTGSKKDLLPLRTTTTNTTRRLKSSEKKLKKDVRLLRLSTMPPTLNSRLRKPPRKAEIWRKPPKQLLLNSIRDLKKERSYSITSMEFSTLPRKHSSPTWMRSRDLKEFLLKLQIINKPNKTLLKHRMLLKD